MSSFLFTNHRFQPRWSSAPHRLHPGRREHIYGKVLPMAIRSRHSKTADFLVVLGWGMAITGLMLLASPYQFEALATVAGGFIIAAIGAAIGQP